MADGGSTTWEFTELEVNPEVPDSRFVLDLPPDVKRKGKDAGLSETNEMLDSLLEEEAAEGAAGS